MLRKTPHQRASMKRNPVYESASPSTAQIHRRGRDTRDTNVAYKSESSRKDSLDWNPNEMIRVSEKYGKEGAWGEERDGDSITTEIAPGIIIKGRVAEL